MSNRIIINNNTDLSDVKAILRVIQVMEGGRVSNFGKQYSYATTWSDKIVCVSTQNKKSDSFRLYQS